MNKSTTKQKRPIGKNSPLTKRPKLDFTSTTRASFKGENDIEKESSEKNDDCKKIVKEICGGSSSEKEGGQNLSTSDWDDDFSGDMLEKVCLIADLSQAMVSTQSKDEEKIPSFKQKISLKTRPFPTTVQSAEYYEKLNLELERLQEKLKTKEGEVHILRSQLKQNEAAKQAVAIQNMKVVEEIQEKYNEKLTLIEKELESTKSKLLFKDMEHKTLSERCRQLEYNITKSKLTETQYASKTFTSSLQVTQLAPPCKESCTDKCFISSGNSMKNDSAKLENFTHALHEGKSLAKILCPEFFQHLQEPSVVPFYSYCSETESYKNKIEKGENFKWNELPKQTAQIKDLYKDVSSLFTCEDFAQKEVKETVQTILSTCETILYHQNQIFKFLDTLQLCNVEYEKADRCLLEKEEKVHVITVKNLLNCKKLNEEECGVELRRSLALIYTLIEISKTAFDMVKTNMTFLKFFKDIVASIGKLRRPLTYTGVLVGISFILQKLLEERNLGREFLTLITETVEEIIFARPKLDVLIELINVLAAGKHHMSLLSAMCRRESVDSCMLYMDCKLKQAMFFTKNACPLKLLCMQIMGLASLPCNQNIRWEVTHSVVKWLNSSLSMRNSKNLKWLPINPGFMEEDRCFNVSECLLYLLVLCLNDYNLNFPFHDSFYDNAIVKKSEIDKKKNYLISIIGQGAVLFKRILKADQRQLHENSYSLRFSVLLKAVMTSKPNQYQVSHGSLSSIEMEAMSWITELLESDFRAQDCCLKQNISKLPDIDVFNALNINDETRMY